MARSELIHKYLLDLEKYLSRVSEAQAKEIVQEIESHIYDSLMLQKAPGEGAIETVLGRLGTPRELASGYIDHITVGVAPPKGLKPLSRVKKEISKSLYYVVRSLGYITGVSLIVAALIKLINPSAYGVWIAEHGNTVVVSFGQVDYQQTQISAIWVITLASLGGAVVLYLTAQIVRILKMHF